MRRAALLLLLGFFLFFLKAFPLLLVHRPGLFETVPVFTQFLILLEKLVELLLGDGSVVVEIHGFELALDVLALGLV